MLEILNVIILKVYQQISDPRYRVVVAIMSCSIVYGIWKGIYIRTLKVLPAAKFIQLNNNGSIKFQYGNVTLNLYSNNYILPSKNSNNECELTLFNRLDTALRRINRPQDKIKIYLINLNNAVFMKNNQDLLKEFDGTIILNKNLSKEQKDWCLLLNELK